MFFFFAIVDYKFSINRYLKPVMCQVAHKFARIFYSMPFAFEYTIISIGR